MKKFDPENGLDELALDVVNAIADDMGGRGMCVRRNREGYPFVEHGERAQAKAAWQLIVARALMQVREEYRKS